MARPATLPAAERWAHFRFSIVGPLLAAPPARGDLGPAIAALAAKHWLHPMTGEPSRFGVSTIERWYYAALREPVDRVRALWRRARKDRGRRTALPPALLAALQAQYRAHPSWSYQLHWDNLKACVAADATFGRLPSYSTLRRSMQALGMVRRPRRRAPRSEAAERAAARREQREVRSYEVDHVHALWHFDFHHASRPVLTAAGEWVFPRLLGILDDCSRLVCHAQWYLTEDAAVLAHGLTQAFQKRGLPGATLSDNGSAMKAAELSSGLTRLSITQDFTLVESPYQNAKQEVLWAQVEGRLMAMLEGVPDLTLRLLNDATQAWLEGEYNRDVHSELGVSPIERALAGPSVARACPASDALRLAFTRTEVRSQRRSDGTLCLGGRRFEIPSRYRTLARVSVRYAAWDLGVVHLADPQSGEPLCRIYPLDKCANADGRRRVLAPLPDAPATSASAPAGIAPLLSALLARYAATGLPPAYLPYGENPVTENRG